MANRVSVKQDSESFSGIYSYLLLTILKLLKNQLFPTAKLLHYYKKGRKNSLKKRG